MAASGPKAKATQRTKLAGGKKQVVGGGVAAIVRISRQVVAEFDALRSQIARERAAESKRWDMLWELAGRAIEGTPPIYRARYDSFKAFVAEEFPGESVRSATRNILVAHSFTAAGQQCMDGRCETARTAPRPDSAP